MLYDKGTAQKTADFLLQIKAVKLQPEEPFTWASGWKSPIYCDNRITLSYPAIRTFLREQMVKSIEKNFAKPEAIAGVATGAIALGALVAEQMGLPFVYVRPEAKSHGRKNQIEGQLEPSSNVVIIEDLISTGGSSLKAYQALSDHGNKILGMQAIFTYGFKLADENFKQNDLQLITLCDYASLLEVANTKGYVTDKQMATLSEWRLQPEQWGM